MGFKILARHKWVRGAIITESINMEEKSIRRFVATIRGFRNWKLYEGTIYDNAILVSAIIRKVYEIRDRIDRKDESVFHEKTEIIHHR